MDWSSCSYGFLYLYAHFFGTPLEELKPQYTLLSCTKIILAHGLELIIEDISLFIRFTHVYQIIDGELLVSRINENFEMAC